MASLTLDWLHVIVLLGAIQGLFLTVAIAAKRSNRTANRLLAVCMFAFSVYLATSVYHAVGFEQVAPHFFGLAYLLPFLSGPLVYLYAVAAADRSHRLTRRDAMHFGPFVATVLAGLPIYLMSGAGRSSSTTVAPDRQSAAGPIVRFVVPSNLALRTESAGAPPLRSWRPRCVSLESPQVFSPFTRHAARRRHAGCILPPAPGESAAEGDRRTAHDLTQGGAPCGQESTSVWRTQHGRLQ